MNAVVNPSTHPAFELIRTVPIESLGLDVQEYVHRATGARHLHMATDTDENVFMVALKTVPEDSTGVAHILEHTVLCGSEKYPVRDPFFHDAAALAQHIYERLHQFRLDGLPIRHAKPQRF